MFIYLLNMFVNFVWCMWRPEEGIISLMTGKREGCELSCQYWESNQDPLEQQLLLLTIELSPKPQNIAFILKIQIHVLVMV